MQPTGLVTDPLYIEPIVIKNGGSSIVSGVTAAIGQRNRIHTRRAAAGVRKRTEWTKWERVGHGFSSRTLSGQQNKVAYAPIGFP
jgi:hypothetical protein